MYLLGKIVRIDKGNAHVDTEQGIVLCATRGRLKQGRKTQRNLFAVGDDVEISVSSQSGGVIENVLDRRSKLSRPDGFRPDIEHIMIANVDLIAAITSVAEPPFLPGILDRYIAAALIHELPLLIVVNKTDIEMSAETISSLDEFRALGCDIVLTSAATGAGLKELLARLHDKTTVFTGHSGVGKSSLLRALIPGFEPATAPVSERSGMGKHTTTRVELVRTDFGYVADTPGIKVFGVWGIPPIELGFFFPEIAPYIHSCRFNNCSHRTEPGCAVKSAVAQGAISRRRYESYIDILAELEEMERLAKPW